MKNRKKFNLPNWERKDTTKPGGEVGSIGCYIAHITSDQQGCSGFKTRTEIRSSNFVPSCIRANLGSLNWSLPPSDLLPGREFATQMTVVLWLRQGGLIDNWHSVKHYTNPISLLIGRQTKRQREEGREGWVLWKAKSQWLFKLVIGK